MPLEDHYLGDAAWRKFAEIHKTNSRSGDPWEPAIARDLDVSSKAGKEVLLVALSIIGKDRLSDWFTSEIPALDDATPEQCIRDKTLVNRIRVCLMRYPV